MPTTDYPKAPRWINTEAGHWAWQKYASWRRKAVNALAVSERQQLLAEAEQMMQSKAPAAAAAA